MIQHINPLYTVAGICAVAAVITILLGFLWVDWELITRDIRRLKNRILTRFEGFGSEELDEDWMDVESWTMTEDSTYLPTGRIGQYQEDREWKS